LELKTPIKVCSISSFVVDYVSVERKAILDDGIDYSLSGMRVCGW